MSNNEQIARLFDQMAAGLEILGANPFRANAYARAARTLRDLERDVGAIAGEDPASASSRLADLPGIGASTAAKILDYLATGSIREHREMLAKLPETLFELLAIPGLGPKAIKGMWEGLGIASLADLEAQLDSPELAALPRMGAKTVANIRQAIAFARGGNTRVPLGLAHPLAVELVEHLRAIPGARQVDYAGSLRRGRETIGDLDLLAVGDDLEALREAFCSHPAVTQVLARGDTKCSVRLGVDTLVMQADLRLVPAASWGAAQLYFTGSKEHNVRLRERAVRRGMRLNEYGLFSGTEERPQDHGAVPVAAATEAEVYAALELPFFPPELREDRDELEPPPATLIGLEDLVVELHSHTLASDGRLTIDELAIAARERGLRVLAITDHSKSSVLAGGLDETRLAAHIEAIREADQRIEGITLLAGAEVDILPDGSLDYDDETLAQLDLVIASPHVSLRQDPETATARLLAAIRHPLVHVLGHPTGRLIGKREGLTPDMTRLCEAAAEHRVALEVNSHWLRLDLRDSHVRTAVRHGCLVVVNTDAHDASHLDMRRYGAATARRGGLCREHCPSTWSETSLRKWLDSKR